MKTTENPWMKSSIAAGLAGLLLVGCSKSAVSVGDAKSKLFDNADPAIKASWNAGLSALKTNDYALAITTFQQLLAQPNLTAEQGQAVADTFATASEQMSAAAAKGDPNAKKAMEDLKKLRTR
jgi:hypothetical protein